jgi:hypothetical protein
MAQRQIAKSKQAGTLATAGWLHHEEASAIRLFQRPRRKTTQRWLRIDLEGTEHLKAMRQIPNRGGHKALRSTTHRIFDEDRRLFFDVDAGSSLPRQAPKTMIVFGAYQNERYLLVTILFTLANYILDIGTTLPDALFDGLFAGPKLQYQYHRAFLPMHLP